jgi:hypothetical protein
MLQPHFWNFLDDNRILAGAAIVRTNGAHSLRIIPKPGLSADRSDATRM